MLKVPPQCAKQQALAADVKIRAYLHLLVIHHDGVLKNKQERKHR